jgi:hypothetical protein
MQSNDALNRFHQEICPNIPLDSPEITYRLIEEINISKKREGDNCQSVADSS